TPLQAPCNVVDDDGNIIQPALSQPLLSQRPLSLCNDFDQVVFTSFVKMAKFNPNIVQLEVVGPHDVSYSCYPHSKLTIPKIIKDNNEKRKKTIWNILANEWVKKMEDTKHFDKIYLNAFFNLIPQICH